MSGRPIIPLLLFCVLTGVQKLSAAEKPSSQISIARVEQMPNLPQPFAMRDWRKVTRDYLDLVFDSERRGDHLPLIAWRDDARSQITLPSYVGSKGGPEAINFMAAVVSGGLVGIDMRTYRNHDWVAMCSGFFSADHGVCGNNIGGGSGSSFWYDLFPNVLFYQLCSLNPGDASRERQMRSISDRWHEGLTALGARDNPPALPDFDHLSFNLKKMRSVDNGRWIEPEGGAGIAWCEYMAWARFKDPRYLTAADWSLRALIARPVERSPLYEILLPYAAITAARANAELGRDYDVQKLLNWCFEPMDKPAARPWWGVISDRFGQYDCHGLVGSSRDTGGYAFAMNTFHWAGALAPLPRYDSRYARAIGKWMLNLANASRLYYPNGLPAGQQDHRDWADKNDPNYCLGYEGLRKMPRSFIPLRRDTATPKGRIKSGSYADTIGRDRQYQVLESLTTGEREQLEHIWEAPLRQGDRSLDFQGRFTGETGDRGIQFFASDSADGPWKPLFNVASTEDAYRGSALRTSGERVFIKAAFDEPAKGRTRHATLHVDYLRIRVEDASIQPYATGDAAGSHRGTLNLCLYGSSHVGILGGIISRTTDEKILQLDLLRTDFFHAPAFPTFLFYNPYPQARTFDFQIGPKAADLYDAVTHRMAQRNVSGKTTLSLPADAAAVIVVTPSGGKMTRDSNRTLVDGIMVDWQR